jgi:hypothetical protein
MSDYGTCDICGKPSKVCIGEGNGEILANLCFNCHNKQMAEHTGSVMPNDIPERLTFNDRSRKPCEFDIEFIIFATGKSLTATEIGKTKRKAEVWGNLDDDFSEMLDTLKKRIKKALFVKYMDPDRTIKDNKLVGYIEYNSERDDCDIVVDGEPYTWEELGRNVCTFEGWNIKIEFGDIGAELD